MDLMELRVRRAASISAYNDVICEFLHCEELPRANYNHPWWGVKSRVLKAPVEFHEHRYTEFRKQREREERGRYDKANARRLPCGCVVSLDGAEQTPVHYCPTHWAQRRNRYAAAR